MNISKELKTINALCGLELINGVTDAISKLPISMEELANTIYDKNYESDNYNEDLKNLLSILQYVYNLTTMEELVSNELYDKLYEVYKELTGSDMVGSNVIPVGKKTALHQYPHLRGSLDKVHYLLRSDIPKGDSRKCLEDWILKCINQTPFSVSHFIRTRLKYDGVSLVFEFDKYKNLLKALTRGDTEQNIAQDVTDTFKFYTFETLFGDLFTGVEFTSDFALKTECMMTQDNFERYNETNGLNLKNTRSAIISFINSEDHSIDDLTYISLEVLELSTLEEVKYDDTNVNCDLEKVYSDDEFINYIVYEQNSETNKVFEIKGDSLTTDTVSEIRAFINNIISKFSNGEFNIPVDGIVFTNPSPNVVKEMGRKENINKFQVAYKFPAGIKKSRVTNVKFQVGLIGGITPVVQFEPIVIMGNTLENVSTGSINKFEELDINIGDEIIIKYDIVPVIFKDDSCIKGKGIKVDIPIHCPICGTELFANGLNVSCENDDCNSRIVGKIINYVNKLDIKHIGEETIATLVEHGYLQTIADLYRLHDNTGSIIQLRGFKETMMNKINTSIFSKVQLYPHDLLGSIGIPTIGRRMMEKVCRVIPFEILLREDDIAMMVNKLSNINGIGEKTAIKMLQGIEKNYDLIVDLLRYISIIPYSEEQNFSEIVVFTKIRDKEFEKFLETKGVKTASSYSKNTDVVITKNPLDDSVKLKKAKEDGKLVLSLEEAKERYGYV